MGSILSSKVREDGKIVFEVVVDKEEALQLKGQLENVYIYSEKNSNYNTAMTQRGKNDATKYFLIPRELRNNLDYDEKVVCQRIETKTKSTFIFSVDKNEFKKSKNRHKGV
jgi:hypothetical protein